MNEYPDIKPNYVKPEMLAEGWKPYKRDPETHVRYWAYRAPKASCTGWAVLKKTT